MSFDDIVQRSHRTRFANGILKTKEECLARGDGPRLTVRTMNSTQVMRFLDCPSHVLYNWIQRQQFPKGEYVTSMIGGSLRLFWTEDEIITFKNTPFYQKWLTKRKSPAIEPDRKPLRIRRRRLLQLPQ